MRTTGRQWKPRLAILYGPPGVGKSTCAAQCDAHIVDVENGTKDIDCSRESLAEQTWESFCETIGGLIADPVPNPVIAIDTMTAVESLIAPKVLATVGKASLAEIEFGKAGGMLMPYWEKLLRGLEKLMATTGQHVLLLAHEATRKVKPSDQEAYTRYVPSLEDPGCSAIYRAADDVLFYRIVPVIYKEDANNKRSRLIAMKGEADRVFQCRGTVGALAKNRVGLPLEIESWEEYACFLKRGHKCRES
jgi:DNA polymerase III delta prime subunit